MHLPGEDIFLISLIEHKSDVDYNVAMQLFYYMAFIWHDYALECEKLHHGITKTKDFRYPAILPIVYFEGSGEWTAPAHLKDRIQPISQIIGFTPDFEYKLVRLHDYTQDVLLAKKDELSFLMMINKLKEIQDYNELNLPQSYVEKVTTDSSADVLDVMAKIISVMLRKIEVTEDQITEITSMMRRGNMGEFMKYFNQSGYSVRKVTEEVTQQVTAKTRITLVCKKLAKGKNLSQIADECELTENEILPFYDFSRKYAPDYDPEQVFQEYWSQQQAEANNTDTNPESGTIGTKKRL
ncbi:MAG: Rpn family recombination-promoting nuclease/putative transposase [Lachnospiraceae bacterium]|nr:Rpn family recombination-promoting nuclease/putative transposase [Lachnospiraceae bacterium]